MFARNGDVDHPRHEHRHLLSRRASFRSTSERWRASLNHPEIELLSHASLDSTSESIIRKFLSSVEMIGLSPSIKDAAIALRREHRLTIPDAIIAATALTAKAELLTNDGRLLALPVLQTRPLPLKP